MDFELDQCDKHYQPKSAENMLTAITLAKKIFTTRVFESSKTTITGYGTSVVVPRPSTSPEKISSTQYA